MFNKQNIPFSKPSPLSKLSEADISFASLNKEALLKNTRGDKYIWGIVLVLALISVLVVYSSTGS